MKILVWADDDRIPEARVQANLYAAENGEANPSILSRDARLYDPDASHEGADVVVVQAEYEEIVEAYAHQEEILEPGTEDPLHGPCDVVLMQFEDDEEEEEEPQEGPPEEEGVEESGEGEASEEASDSEGSEEGEPEEGPQEAAEGEEAEEAAEDPWEGVDATDAAVALAREANLTPAQVTGTGEDGRILKGDVEDAIEAQE